MDEHPRHIIAVTALVTNPQGEALMIRSPKRGWEFPGGQVEEGESLMEALSREVMEETGVEIRIGNLAGIYTRVQMPAMVIFAFLAGWVSGEPRTSEESPEVAWVACDKVLERATQPTIRGRMKDMLEFQGRVVYRVYVGAPYRVLDERLLTGWEAW